MAATARAPVNAPAPTLTAYVQALLDGPLARFASTATGAAVAWPLPALTDTDTLAAVIEAWGESRDYPDPRVRVTQWSKYFWRGVLPPWLLGAAMGAELRLDDAVLVCRGNEPAPLRFDLYRVDELRHPAAVFAPSAKALADVGRMSPRVVSSNAGNLLHAVIEYVPGVLPALAPRLSALQAEWLETRHFQGRRNPLFRPVLWRPGSPPRRVRRLCCLRYRDAALGYCATCPLIKP